MKRRATLAAIAVGAAITLAGFAASTAAGAATTRASATPNRTCLGNHDDEWPDWVTGQPAGYQAGADGGVYLWHDATGWNVRVTHKTDDRLYVSGTILTSGVFDNVQGVALERNDHFTVSPDRHAITFRFNNYGHIDGLDFTTHCAPALLLNFGADGHELPANRVVIGHDDTHPDTDPFTIWRTQ